MDLTEGVVLRLTEAAGSRGVVHIFTREFGKLSAGVWRSALHPKAKKKAGSPLAFRPFTLGNYQLTEGRGMWSVNGAETERSFYGLGEDLDRYACASYVLELTDRILPEMVPQPVLFDLLKEFLSLMEKRKQAYLTLVLAFELKAIACLGAAPDLGGRCVNCGAALTEEEIKKSPHFSIPGGGLICGDCLDRLRRQGRDELIYSPGFDIVSVINYISASPLSAFEKLALGGRQADELQRIVRKYLAYHLDVDRLKSEHLMPREG